MISNRNKRGLEQVVYIYNTNRLEMTQILRMEIADILTITKDKPGYIGQ